MINFTSQQILEILANGSVLLNIYLAARLSLWNWFFGSIAVLLFMILFFSVKLYADMALQLIFLGFQLYGWYEWRYGNVNHTALTVSTIKVKTAFILMLFAFIFFESISCILTRYTDSTTVTLDALTTTLSLTAQWMMCQKWLENWIVWIVVDIISLKMYLMKHLYFTTFLYAILIGVCIKGFLTWKAQWTLTK